MITLSTHNHLGDHVIMTGVIANAKAAGIDCCMQSSIYDCLYDKVSSDSSTIKVQYNASQRDGTDNCVVGFTKNLAQQLNTNIPIKYTKPILPVENVEQGDYWILQAGYQYNCTVKNWGRVQWQALVDTFPQLHFKQIGLCDKKDQQPMLYGVESLINKTPLPELLKLYQGCKGVIGPISSCTHIAAAYNKPCICIIGQRQSTGLSNYQGIYHCGSKCTQGHCMAFYAGAGTPGKCCGKPAVVGNQIIASCMCCLQEVAAKLRELNEKN